MPDTNRRLVRIGLVTRRKGCSRTGPPRSTAAFTLLEILVSLVVLVLMVTVLSHLLNQTSQLWSRGAASSERLQNVRAINEAIGNELRTALLPTARFPLQAGASSMPVMSGLQFVVNPANPSATSPYATASNPYGPAISATYKHPDAVFWQAPFASDQTLGDVAELGYFVQWDATTHPGNPRALLCRFAVNPAATAAANASPASDPNFLIYSASETWLNDGIIQKVAPANAAAQSPARPYQGLFAENVIGLWVRCLDAYGQTISADFHGNLFAPHGFDSRLGYTDSQGITSARYVDSAGNFQPLYTLPPAVEISVVMLDSHAASLITPTMQSAIIALESDMVANATPNGPPANGRTFVDTILRGLTSTYAGFKPIASSLRSYETKVYLENSK